MKKVYADERWCLGCGLCKVYCRTSHSLTKDIIKAHKLEDPRPVERLHIETGDLVNFALQCRHCDDPKCVQGCITGAMQKCDLCCEMGEPECVKHCPNNALKYEDRGDNE